MKLKEKAAAILRKNPTTTGAVLAKKLGISTSYAYSIKSSVMTELIVNGDLDKYLKPDVIVEPGWTVTTNSEDGAMVATHAHSALDVQVDGDHYKKFKIQPIEFIHANDIPFIEGNIIKYIVRWREKNGLKDLEKVKHYVDLLIDLEKLK